LPGFRWEEPALTTPQSTDVPPIEAWNQLPAHRVGSVTGGGAASGVRSVRVCAGSGWGEISVVGFRRGRRQFGKITLECSRFAAQGLFDGITDLARPPLLESPVVLQNDVDMPFGLSEA